MRLQNGDLKAFDEIFELYKNKAVRTAFLITGDRFISEDAVQESFIQCFNHIKDLKNPDGFRAWFYKILTRVAWKNGKKASLEFATDDIMEEADKQNKENSIEQYDKYEVNRFLYSEIARLKPKLKNVIILYYFNGLSTKEIASAEGCLEGTVKSRLHTARQKLKKRIESVECREKGCISHAKYKIV